MKKQKDLNIVDVITESKNKKRSYLHQYEESKEMYNWINEFNELEKLQFGKDHFVAQSEIVPPGSLNSELVVNRIIRQNPDLVVVFGTGIIKETIIQYVPNIINLHLGLSPFYRGTATTVWPFIEKKPIFNGATILKLDKGIDSGPIYKLVLSDFYQGESIHQINMRLIKKAVDTQVDIILSLSNGKEISPINQELDLGKLYLNKEFKPHHILQAKNFLDSYEYKEFLDNIKINKLKLETILNANGLPYI